MAACVYICYLCFVDGAVPPPPDEFSDLPLPPPELLAEDPTPTNTPVHFAQMTEDFSAMHVQYCGSEDGDASSRSSNSSCSVSNVTPRNSVGTPTKNFDRCSGIRNSLRKVQTATAPKLVAPPRIPEKTITQTPSSVQTMHVQSNQPQAHRYGHYGSHCQQPPASASSLSVAVHSTTPSQSNGHFLAELNNLYGHKGQPPPPIASSESDSDVDELPPPPPELLSPELNGCSDGAYGVPYNQTANGLDTEVVYSVPPPPLAYNPYGDRMAFNNNPPYPQNVNSSNSSGSQEPYSMSRVFASQTGTIKRAPQPPKRNNSISTIQRNGSVR